MAGHEHGSMDTTEHQKTYQGFLRVAAYVALVAVVILLVLTTRI